MNLNNINIRHLYYFWLIAKRGSIKSASQKLNLSQPTVSDQLKLFEEFVGQPLFARRHRKLLLTRFGEEILLYADKIFSITDDLVTFINNKEKTSTQIINIGIVPTLATNLIYHIIYPLFQRNDFFIRVREGEISFLYHELEMNRLDLIITGNLPNINIKNYEINELFRRNFKFVCGAKNYRLTDNFPDSLNGFPFINYTKSTDLYYKIEAFFHGYNIRPKIIAELDEINLIQKATEDGICFSMLPLRAIKESLRQEKLFVFNIKESFSSTMYSIIKKQKNPFMDEIIDVINQQLKKG
ncbi:MAG: LysR family transcriptional regulator [Deltaproteobacteria bacterium]|nr:LysR family transcriptional regulator [Deltaproteobacteria bacterium]